MFDLSDLNPQQLEAVQHNGSPLLVVAGAGTGKTNTLATRVARLLHDGVPADRMLLLTFSRRAAREMLGRAARLAGTATADRVWGGTFHAVANRLLREYGAAVGVAPSFSVMDQSDSGELFGLVRGELALAEQGKRFPRKDTLAAIYSRTVSGLEKLGPVLQSAFPWCAEHEEGIQQLFLRYTTRKRERQLLDFDDLLLYWRALAADERAGALRSRFDHILVDEYQDTNVLQGDILHGMAAGGAEVCAVGDDAQAIYGFRAASNRNMLEFPERFAGTRIITLDQNYRSTPSILAAANAVIDQAAAGYKKELWSTRPDGGRPALVTCGDERAQSDWVCNAVLEQLEAGVALREQCVLFRAGHHSDGLEVELSRRRIPFVKYGGLKFVEAAHVKDLVALVRLLDNPVDELAWHRVLGLLEGVGPATTRSAMAALGFAPGEEARPTDDPVLRFVDGAVHLSGPAGADADRLRTVLADCHGREDLPIAAQIQRLRAFYVLVLERKYDAVAARNSDLDHLEALAGEAKSRAEFLSDLTLDPPSSSTDLAGPPHLDDDFLILSTIHSAKGLEWKAVYVIHAADGNIPSDMALGEPGGLDEERRLLYVALTRARDTLHVAFPQRFYQRKHALDDVHSYAPVSRFLSPIKDCFDEHAAGLGPGWGGGDLETGAIEPGHDPVGALLADLFQK